MVCKGEALAISGEAAQGVECILQGIQLNPHHPEWYLWHLGIAYYMAARFSDSIETFNKMANHNIDTRLFLAASHARLGRKEAAAAQAQKIFELDPVFTPASLSTTHATGNSESLEHLLEGLRIACLPE